MIGRWIILMAMLAFGIGTASAQDAALEVESVEVVSRIDVFGQTVLTAEGRLTNPSTTLAYSEVSLSATAYDQSDTAVGEGFGYLANACGAALLPDFVLLPGAAQHFAVPLELYEEGAVVERVEVTVDALPVDAPPVAVPELAEGIQSITSGEVVQVEWIDAETFRYAEGCARDLFIDWNWTEYSLSSGAGQPVEHPKAALVTEALRRQLGLTDPLYFQHSFLSYAPNARRMVYQTELNIFITAEPDGSFKRQLFDKLFDRTLQGITWLPEGRFLAYYYGAYGDPVTYFTATVDGQILSEAPPNAIPSLTVPGVSPTGEDIIISAEVDGKTGFYIKRAAYPVSELLFESPVPGNNWPGPIYQRDADGAAFIYAAVPQGDAARLVCFNRQTETLRDLAALPLRLASDERAWWFLSPEGSRIALAANGLNGGLWLIDLAALPACE
ncbi:MAG: hypothetical protein JNM70_13565 [Anaerolineae bacterium]|nr:hypothetical protein [Anaerolineae bacterium]